MLIDAKTRIKTTLGAVLQDADQEFIATANAMAFRESHQTCLACRAILTNDATVCDHCGILVSPPRSDNNGSGRAFSLVFMMLGGAVIFALCLPIVLLFLYAFIRALHI